ncbi:MAG TPA: hypothetical protein VEC99_01045, partial [Clostridia bacterium]|nr:hypothetical protein [Clostridia bacterium]
NDTCSCIMGSWNCLCDGYPPICPDFYPAVCMGFTWDCGTVTTCPPDCGGGGGGGYDWFTGQRYSTGFWATFLVPLDALLALFKWVLVGVAACCGLKT